MNLRIQLAMLGPGLLYAGAAIGVSHLVQSTRAGAEFGLQMIAVVILANVVKYPFFELSSRYVAATGNSLLEGYRQLGKWALWLYVAMTVSTMFIVMAAISVVTAGLFTQFTSFGAPDVFVAIGLLVASALVLLIGQYNTLDKLMKVVVVLLTISTLATVILSFIYPAVKVTDTAEVFDFSNSAHVVFLIALIGWMPAPIDIAIWHSVWSVSKNKSLGRRLSLSEGLRDFRIGYWGTTVMAIFFVFLGANMMYGSGEEIQASSIGFAGQLIRMYTGQLGEWSFPMIALAAFTTMFSTMLTCLDAFPRTLRRSFKLLLLPLQDKKYHKGIYHVLTFIVLAGTAIILLFFMKNMRQMVDLATTISFVLAPAFAGMNYLVANNPKLPEGHVQPRWLRVCNIASILLLALFTIWFLALRP